MPQRITANLAPAALLPPAANTAGHDFSLSPKLRDEIITALKPLDPDKVILFGSYAWGSPSESSDIDLFIVKKCDPHSVRACCLEAMRQLRPLIFKYKKGFDVLLDDPARIKTRIDQLHDQFYAMIIEMGVALYAK